MSSKTWHRFYDPGVPPVLEFEDITLPGFLERSAAAYPDATALIFLNRTMTYRELQADVDRFAAALARRCLHRSLLIRQPVSEPTASSASTARLRQIPWAGRSRTRARRPQRYVA